MFKCNKGKAFLLAAAATAFVAAIAYDKKVNGKSLEEEDDDEESSETVIEIKNN